FLLISITRFTEQIRIFIFNLFVLRLFVFLLSLSFVDILLFQFYLGLSFIRTIRHGRRSKASPRYNRKRNMSTKDKLRRKTNSLRTKRLKMKIRICSENLCKALKITTKQTGVQLWLAKPLRKRRKLREWCKRGTLESSLPT